LYSAYLIAIVMTLSVLEGHSHIASLFKWDISYLWSVIWPLCICRASCWGKQCISFAFPKVQWWHFHVFMSGS